MHTTRRKKNITSLLVVATFERCNTVQMHTSHAIASDDRNVGYIERGTWYTAHIQNEC